VDFRKKRYAKGDHHAVPNRPGLLSIFHNVAAMSGEHLADKLKFG
jgi:hypothetical protein